LATLTDFNVPSARSRFLISNSVNRGVTLAAAVGSEATERLTGLRRSKDTVLLSRDDIAALSSVQLRLTRAVGDGGGVNSSLTKHSRNRFNSVIG